MPGSEVSLASAIVAAAQVHAELGDPSGALTELAEAERLAIHALGPIHPNVATTLIAQLEPLALLDRFDDAIAVGRRAVAIYDRVTIDPVTISGALRNLAIVQQMGDHSNDAIVTLQRARPLLERAVGPDHADVGTLLFTLGSIQKDNDKLDAAVANYKRVVEIWTKTLGADSLQLARPLTALGEIELLRHQPARAMPLLERALVLRERAGANVPPKHLAHTKELLAEAHAALKHRN